MYYSISEVSLKTGLTNAQILYLMKKYAIVVPMAGKQRIFKMEDIHKLQSCRKELEDGGKSESGGRML